MHKSPGVARGSRCGTFHSRFNDKTSPWFSVNETERKKFARKTKRGEIPPTQQGPVQHTKRFQCTRLALDNLYQGPKNRHPKLKAAVGHWMRNKVRVPVGAPAAAEGVSEIVKCACKRLQVVAGDVMQESQRKAPNCAVQM
ncbi:hypothetical protein GWK47_044537 [Chionoecetes opilio]|uniref:Uncharacterized protein n=1 Tax=Chionoecetes opilio TaxID=41210 RepID=A0A8J4YGD5_CHIOP|nr:hypothetical protein GWK47_044537 [Chionoecetes opilio]